MRKNKATGILAVNSRNLSGGYNCVVDLTTLQYDDYQRGEVPGHRLVDNWNDKACQPLQVSLRNGRLYCYDGLQRTTTMLNRGTTKWDATVFDDMSYAALRPDPQCAVGDFGRGLYVTARRVGTPRGPTLPPAMPLRPGPVPPAPRRDQG